jgi:Peptidase family C25
MQMGSQEIEPDLPPLGLDATTGGYLHPGLPLAEVAALARARKPDGREAAEAREWLRRRTGPHLGARFGVDPRDLASAGWAVVFPRDVDPAVREALQPLLEHRRRQAAARKETFYREFDGPAGYQPGDTKASFLERHGAGGGGPADPREVPYYLTLVGGPEAIPFEVQHQLDVQYAVGRLCFDSPGEYARYAESVVAAETGGRPPLSRRAVLFAPRAPGDRATELMADHLVARVAAFLREEEPSWTIETAAGDAATKARLGRFLGGEETPSLLFTATHGMGFPADDPRQRERQGALLCQDWPGPGTGPIPEGAYLSAADVGEAARPAGLVTFHYACHSAGTPCLDAYNRNGSDVPRRLAPADFVARLPQRLLGHPAGGALAVVGHVERTWAHSFLWKGAQTEIFEDLLKLLLTGWPVGAALEGFGQRYAALASDLLEEERKIGFGKRADPETLVRLWTATRDARNYLLLGDPAVRLPAAA